VGVRRLGGLLDFLVHFVPPVKVVMTQYTTEEVRAQAIVCLPFFVYNERSHWKNLPHVCLPVLAARPGRTVQAEITESTEFFFANSLYSLD
jgi:hypothetical protein